MPVTNFGTQKNQQTIISAILVCDQFFQYVRHSFSTMASQESWLELYNVSNGTLPPTTDSNPAQDGSLNTLKQIKSVMYWIEIILELCVLVAGVTGNLLSQVVMVKKKWRGECRTTRCILVSLAMSDNIMLLTHVFNQSSTWHLLGTDLRALSSFGCKTFYVLYHSSKMTSSWFVVGLCFERLIAVTCPFKANEIITPLKLSVSISLNYIIIITYNSVFSFATGIRNDQCIKDNYNSNNEQTYKAFLLTSLFIYIIVPMLLLLIFTPFIVHKLIQHYNRQKNLSKSFDGDRKNNRHLNSLIRNTACLLSVIIGYIILLTPMAVFQQLLYWQQIQKQPLLDFVLKKVAQRLEQLNYAVNFFLYICTSPQFRAGLKELCGCTSLSKLSYQTSVSKTAFTN